KRLTSRWDEIRDITRATTLGTLVVAVFGVAFRIWAVNRIFLALFLLLTTSSVILSRMIIRETLAYARRHGKNLRNMLVIGTNPRALELVQRIQGKPELGYRILGFADEEWLGLEEFKKQGHVLVSDLDALPSYVRRNIVDEVVLALPIRSFHGFASQIAAACEQQGIIVRFLPNIFDLKETRQRADEFDGDPLISHESTITDFWGLAAKRAIDIVVLFVAMVVDAEQRLKDIEHQNEANGPVFKIKKDPRIMLVGSFLCKTSIDELPQLFNVLKGEMSLVGPRPLQVRDYELFETFCQDWQRKRFSVRPGITCLWQIMGRSSTTFEKWMELDLQYIRTWSLWLDLEILAKTVPAVLKGSGAA